MAAFDTIEAIRTASGEEQLPPPVPVLALIVVGVIALLKRLAERVQAHRDPRALNNTGWSNGW